MASHLYDTLGKDIVTILKTHDVPESALKDSPDCLRIHLKEGLLEGEVDDDKAEELLTRNRETYSSVSAFASDRGFVSKYNARRQIIKIYPIH